MAAEISDASLNHADYLVAAGSRLEFGIASFSALHLRLRLFSLVFLSLLGLAAASAHALEVRVDAPEELKPLLEQYLETARAVRLGEALTDEELLRLQQTSLVTAHELLATEGYFSPQISSTIEGAGANQRVRYSVVPGPRTLVGAIDIRFEGRLVETPQADAAKDTLEARNKRLRKRILDNFALKPGMPFRQADWDAAKNTALRPLLRSTYQAARLASSEARVDPAAQRASLSLVIDSGPAFFYGPLQISGNERYPASVIAALNPAVTGEPVRQQQMQDYQQALDATGYFSQVIVLVNPDPAVAAAAPILVTVVERKEQQLSFGVGYSTDTGARVQTTYLHRDIFGSGERLKLELKLEHLESSALAELAWPRSARGYENRTSLSFLQEEIEGQDTDSWKTVISRNRKRDRIDATLSLQYQFENQTVDSLPTVQNEALSLGYAWMHRTDGRAFYPVRGHITNLQASVASESLLSKTSFVRLYGRHTEYFKLGDKGRLLLRGELGAVMAEHLEGIPTDFLFRAGGENSVRGYKHESLGLNVAGAVQSVRNLATASIEYNYFFTPTWGAALFVDAGDAADSIDELSPAVGAGVGVRYKSPIGPINVDLAYGQETEEFQVHFQLGVAF
ncbi:MAG: BamA/TamA family outer membrane protein [Thiobacillus sp.]|nr:BamA/TamA family outer membrane protein [Thiobacillus sp.]